jgi:hypothetical protein
VAVTDVLSGPDQVTRAACDPWGCRPTTLGVSSHFPISFAMSPSLKSLLGLVPSLDLGSHVLR